MINLSAKDETDSHKIFNEINAVDKKSLVLTQNGNKERCSSTCGNFNFRFRMQNLGFAQSKRSKGDLKHRFSDPNLKTEQT